MIDRNKKNQGQRKTNRHKEKSTNILLEKEKIDKQTNLNRQIDTQTNRHIEKQTQRQIDKKTNRRIEKQTKRQTDEQTNIHRDKEKYRHIDKKRGTRKDKRLCPVYGMEAYPVRNRNVFNLNISLKNDKRHF